MSPRRFALRAQQRLWAESEATYRQRIRMLTPRGAQQTLLDVGCHDGAWTTEVAQAAGIPAANVSGIEIVDDAREEARRRGFDVRPGNLEEAWPFPDESFDVVHANQVIEHVKRLDHFVDQIQRVLKPGGHAIVCTENLSSWHNVAAVGLGYMPFSLTNISAKDAIGNPFAPHAGKAPAQDESWQHIHVLTLEGLVAILELHGLHVVERFGAGYYPAFGRPSRWLSDRDPRHAHFIGALATKKRDPARS